MQRLSLEPTALHVARLAPLLEWLQVHLALTVLLRTSYSAYLELHRKGHNSHVLLLEEHPEAPASTLRLEADNVEFERLAPRLMSQGAHCLEASREHPSASRGCAWRVLTMPLPGDWQLMLLALDPHRCQHLGPHGLTP
ncbi:hypothetical protein KZO83_16050 [Chromohalobacter sp. TMW 2.2308]|uniref:VOC domain-containing protein n=1 Tax=Chromohalobacter moromii TaxID=2860329 RepID=A0A9X3AYL8_9GAMM|nr:MULTISPECIES: hypothetical protein [Chromohalobacter]CDQ37533.1 hypothetical protein BN993_07089 [Virgibacillus halodenitrificans]MCK2044206.1 hypothetical protein [Chromohalobacter moromii]MCK2047284.1 hypothetical protein [Chromohalobacter moromii]MCT8506862.1 hypothetical protein [Chromohalobacter moromii]MCT8516317.1 hypothetical protein [Chromohalobacter sp. TMW 2.2271]